MTTPNSRQSSDRASLPDRPAPASKGMIRFIRIPLLFALFAGALGCLGGLSCDQDESPELTYRLEATFVPRSLRPTPGQTLSTELTIAVRDPIDFPVTGVNQFHIADALGIDIEPNDFTIDFTNKTTETRTVTVSVSEGASSGRFDVRWGSLTLTDEFSDLTVDVQTGNIDFRFTADPETISGRDYVLSDESIEFYVTSETTFSGQVRVSYNSSNLATTPDTNNFSVDVAPNSPAIFTRRFTRSATPGPQTMTWTATHVPSATTRTLTITVHPIAVSRPSWPPKPAM